MAPIDGGGNSVALILLCKNSGLDLSLAYSDSNLPGAGPEEAIFLQEFASSLHVPFFFENFAAKHAISTRTTRRKLRHKWFEELRKTHGFDYILTVHHSNDGLSTSICGADLKELTGIPDQNGCLGEPLITFSQNRYGKVMPYKRNITTLE